MAVWYSCHECGAEWTEFDDPTCQCRISKKVLEIVEKTALAMPGSDFDLGYNAAVSDIRVELARFFEAREKELE